jgi:hypothetical protein
MKKISIISLFVLFACTQQSYSQWSCCDTISFEKPTTNIVIDTLPGNLWQIGKPQKPFFNSAHSETNAILTDSIYNYPPNDTSSFVYIIHNPYIQTCYTCMEFWHKYDMDTLTDKGIIDASYDGGNSWVLVKDTMNSFYFNWNSDYHESNGNYTQHKLIISGKSDGWIQSTFCWQWQIFVKKMDNKDGWMIDDIIVNAAVPGSCSSINEISKENHISVFPNPFNRQTNLQTDTYFKNATLTLYNSFGQHIKQINNITGQTVPLQRGNLPSGLYHFRLTQDNQIIATGKFVITDN